MPDQESLDMLLEDIENAETVEELQTHVLFANRLFQQDEGVEFADIKDGGEGKMGQLEVWISKVRTKMDRLATEHNATSYTLSISGSITGPSFSMGVTYSTDDNEAD